MKKIFFFLFFSFCALLCAEKKELSPSRIASLETSGFGNVFSLTEQGFEFDSSKAKAPAKFRWAYVKLPSCLSGDFAFSADYRVLLFSHYNGFEIELNSVEKNAFSAVFRRSMDGGNKNMLHASVTVKGKKVFDKALPYSIHDGTLLLKRSGSRLIFEAVSSGKKVTAAEFSTFPKGDVRLAIHFTSAPKTESKVLLKKFTIEASWVNLPVLYPGIRMQKFRQEGFTKAFSCTGKDFIFDSRKIGESGKFRWARIRYPAYLGNSFSCTLDYAVEFFSHFNGFEMNLKSMKKDDFSATLNRSMAGGNKNVLRAFVTVKGKKVFEKTLPYGNMKGALRMIRRKDKITFSAIGADGKELKIGDFSGLPEGPGELSVHFSSAAKTESKVILRNLAVESEEEISAALYPVYGPVRKIADAVIFPGKCRKDADLYTIPAGGKLVCAVMGKNNMRSPRLDFRSSGRVNLTFFQAGNAENGINGEMLLSDEKKNSPALRNRSVFLSDYLNRYPVQRKWKYPQISYSPCLLFEFSSADGNEIRIGNVALSASEMEPGSAVKGKREKLSFDAAGILTPGNKGKEIRLSGKRLPFKTGDKIGKSFSAVDVRLEKGNAVTIPVHRKFGSLALLSAAGKRKDADTDLPAACQIVYEDGNSFTEFLTLRWNTGYYAESFAPRGSADHTWWGPTPFPRGELVFLPYGAFGEIWHALFRTSIRNAHPEKSVREITFYAMPGGGEFLIAGALIAPEKVLSSVEPDHAVLEYGKKECVRAFFFAHDPKLLPEGEKDVFLVREKQKQKIGSVKLLRSGNFSYGETHFTLPRTVQPGPCSIEIGNSASRLLGLMPEKYGKFHYTMIAGPYFSRCEFERIRRIGFDTVKLDTPWLEDGKGNVVFKNSENYLNYFRDYGLDFSIRNHARLSFGPESFKKNAVFQMRYQKGKKPELRPQIDPADKGTCERIVELYRQTARFALKTGAVSINANYGLRPEIGLGKIDMGNASLAMFRKLLAKKYSLAEVSRRTGKKYASFEEIMPLDLSDDASGFLLKEYAVMHHANLEKVQTDVVKAIRKEGYKGHLTYNVSFHPIEHKLIGSNTGMYLRLSRDYPPGSMFHETSDRYSLSFVKWLSAKRSLSLPYGDEGCACPPGELSNRIAYLWMGMMQCWDSLCCQWWGGRPGMFSMGSLKSLHALVYDAEYLPDPFNLALALDSGFDEIALTHRSTLHGSTRSHYSLASTLRELNFNADRYMIDEFPELDKNVGKGLLIDDISRAIRPAFAARLDSFIRAGGVFLASSETDMVNDYAFLKKYGIDPAKVPKKAVVTKKIGKGKVILRNASWKTESWDPGLPKKTRDELRKLLTEAGNFKPLVFCDVPGLLATPYRAKNGDLLLQVVNIAGYDNAGRIGIRSGLAGSTVYDHTTGETVQGTIEGDYLFFPIRVKTFSGTVLRIPAGK